MLVLGLGVALLAAALAVDAAGRVDQARPARAMVVLGARVDEGGVASPTLRARVEQAAALYRRGLAPLVVFSGGVGTHPPSEAAVGSALAQQRGVPAGACLLEAESHSTAQNAANTARLLRARGIDEVIVVTDPYHQLRARRAFWRQGIKVLQSPVLAAPREVDALQRAWWTLREVLALAAHPSLLLAEAPGG